MNKLNDLYFEFAQILKENNVPLPFSTGIYNAPGHEYIECEWSDKIDDANWIVEITIDKNENCSVYFVEYKFIPFTTIDGFSSSMKERIFSSEVLKFKFNDLRSK